MKNLWKNLPAALGGAYLQLLIRAVALTPLCFALAGTKLNFAGKYSSPVLYALTVVLYACLVMPARSLGWARLRKLMGGKTHKASPGLHIRRGFKRLLRGTVWGIPFWVMFIYFVWGFSSRDLPATAFFSPMMSLGELVAVGDASQIDKGIALYLGILLLAALVYAFGWWLDTASDYMDPSAKRLFRASRQLRRKHVLRFYGMSVTQGLLLIPSAALMVLVLYMFYRGEISWSGGVFTRLRNIWKALGKPLPGSVLAYLSAVLVVLHVPLCLIRKARMAAMVCDLEKLS